MRFLANENIPLDAVEALRQQEHVTAPSSAVVAQKVVAAIAPRDDWAGHFSVVEDDKVRMRLL